MVKKIDTRRSVLKSTGKVVAVSSLAATAGCLGGDEPGPSTESESTSSSKDDRSSVDESQSSSSSNIIGVVDVVGPAKNVSAESALTATGTGYSLEIIISNGSGGPVEISGDVNWRDRDSNLIEKTSIGTSTAEIDEEKSLKINIRDSENTVYSYFGMLIAVPA
ncbi:hypothetical protein PN417_09920 [Halorubrum ezzemoulense]|uniref:hypothetical protein n=1 Tax=Halorubrum ezzemoulense TaxID=337243 RepID=UPI00232F478A|nr:hypothetical protein [Halorubrum ezzemoulense]MDB9301251.1 hypothetical protein [Halorubrum ezzemoulense]